MYICVNVHSVMYMCTCSSIAASFSVAISGSAAERIVQALHISNNKFDQGRLYGIVG